MKLLKGGYLLIVLIALTVCGIYSMFFLDERLVHRLAREDGFVETLSALMLFAACIGFGVAYFRSSRAQPALADPSRASSKRNIFHLLLCLFFLLAFLEEISWGQRIFNIQSPEDFVKYNTQREINIHNLKWVSGRDESDQLKPFLQRMMTAERLYNIFWFSYCVCIPLLATFSQWVRNFCARIRFPVVPVHYAFLFMLNHVVSKVIVWIYPIYDHSIQESKEMGLAFLFMCAAMGQVSRSVDQE